MKKWNVCLLSMCLVFHGCAAVKDNDKIRDAFFNGATLRMTFHVTDTQGVPVSNALVNAVFRVMNKEPTEKAFTTDTNGMCTVEGLCFVNMNCSFSKEGYYGSVFNHRVLAEPPDIKDGKWQPWNPEIKITMKEKRNPIPMYVKQSTIRLPQKGEVFGFDFKVGDLVEPYGKGEQADLFFKCVFEKKSEAFGDFKRELFITAVQPDEGIIVREKEKWSEFRSAYEAQESGYGILYYLVTDRTPSKILQEINKAEDEYLTFRSRIVRDDEGGIISSNYGKIIDGKFDYGVDDKNPDGAVIMLLYYFNPTPNDRNLEYDPDENLFDKKKFRGMQP